jgi:outer membrane protein
LPENAVVTAPRKQEKPAEDLDRLKALALEHREDYAGALLNQKVADENITIVKGAYLPQVYAEGGIQYQDSRPTIITDETVYYGGIRLQIPIFEGGLMKAEVSSARSKLRQSEYSTELLRRNIETDVYEAYVNLQTVTTVLESAKLQYADAKENFDTVANLFAEGLTSSLAVIDSQQALYVAEREFVGATYDREVAVLRLQKSIGLLGKE